MLVANDQLPVCFHAASDQDGDGFGFEDGSSCLVDQTTRDLTEPNVCIDEDGDGYGWDGVDTCRVDIVPIAGCEDTDPVGDGWAGMAISLAVWCHKFRQLNQSLNS